MKSIVVSCWLMFTLLLVGSNGYKILGIFPMNFRSHYIVTSALLKGLAEAGHEVTVISPYSRLAPVPNYRDITISLGLTNDSGVASRVQYAHTMGLFESVSTHFEYCRTIANLTLMNEKIQAILHDPEEHFDLIIVETFLTDALFGFGQHFNAPIIAISTCRATKFTADIVGAPSPMSYVPNLLLPFTSRMSFFQRFANTLLTLLFAVHMNFHLAAQNQLYERGFPGKNKPHLLEVRKHISLVLLNDHYSLSYPRPYTPNMIEIGGIHVNRNAAQELPSNIQQFIESGSEYGIIYFSLGSTMQGTILSNSTRNGLLTAFAKLKQKVLWKWEDPNLPGKPDNVLISKWFPQEDVLAHPKIRLFITHGGLLSITEAVYHGIPIIGIPLISDQGFNVASAVDKGYGIAVSFKNLTETSISWALDEMLRNDKYAKNAKIISARYRDQPMTPMETAVYWVEYVARHKGAPHMYSSSQDLNFITYNNLDIYAFLFVIVYAFYWLARVLTLSILRKFFQKSQSLPDKPKQM